MDRTVGPAAVPAVTLERAPRPACESRPQLSRQIACLIAGIDAVLSRQVNVILHHPRFQQLEASWQGLRLLVQQADKEEGRKVKLLTATKRELYKDVDNAIEFDQSELYRKIYRDEFKTAGGEPFGVLIGDFEFSHHLEDVTMLRKISEVAALSFCPFIAGASPTLFGTRDFSALELPRDLDRQFSSEEYREWQALRNLSESTFIGLTLPHILLRLPYGQGELRDECFDFREEVDGPDAGKYLWGNAAYALGQVLMRAFAETGWLVDIRGVTRDEAAGGLVTGLPVASFGTDRVGVVAKCPTDLTVVDTQEKDLAEVGVIPLCHCHGTEFCAFYGTPSLRRPKTYNETAATLNAKVSAMLHYVFCASRFAHFLNAIARDLIGSNAEASDIQKRLNDWLNDNYVLDDPNPAPELIARRPLRAGQCQVRERHGTAGNYDCVIHLQPHYQLDGVTAELELKPLRLEAATAS